MTAQIIKGAEIAKGIRAELKTKVDELKKLQAEGVWPPDTIEKADELLGRKKTTKTKKKTTTAKDK